MKKLPIIIIMLFVFSLGVYQEQISVFAATTVAELQKELAELKAKNEAAKAQKETATTSIDDIENQIFEIKEELVTTQENIDSKNIEIANKQAEIAQTQLEINEINRQIPVAKKESATILKGFQQAQHSNVIIELIMSSFTENPSESIKTVEALNKLTIAASIEMLKLIELQNQLYSLEEQQDIESAQLDLEKEQLETQEIELNQKQTQLDTMLADQIAKQAEAADEESEYDQLMESQQDILDFYTSAGCEGDDIYGVDCGPKNETSSSSTTAVNSGFMKPTYSGYVTCEYYCYADHIGIDVASDNSTEPIYPVAPGTVISVQPESTSGGFGNLVVIMHQTPTGLVFSYYGHMSSISVSEGQEVGYETQVGNMGNTGNSTGAHLHLEIIPDSNGNGLPDRYPKPGESVNPRSYVNFPAEYVHWSSR